MTRTIVDIHIIQTVPPSNLNRDDTGSPKTASYGGVQRARVSSQAWKRATRHDFENYFDKSDLGVRTKRVVELIGAEIGQQAPDLADDADDIVKAIFKAANIALAKPPKGGLEESKYLIFLSQRQVEALATFGIQAARSGGLAAIDKRAVKAVVNDKNSVDVALFGRMVADDTELNVDASAQVAHALSVHAVGNEYDFYTAVDDHKNDDVEEDSGAGMMGTVEFNSSTLYRYATVNVDALEKNLGNSVATSRAIGAFVRSFVTSMPTGKQNTFANRTLPDAVIVVIRDDRAISLVGAYEEPLQKTNEGGWVRRAAECLVKHAADVHAAFGRDPVKTWVVGVGDRTAVLDPLGERIGFETLLGELEDVVAKRLAESS